MPPKTFGSVISEARKRLQLSQKELALKILKEDGQPISPQYLNDLEHDRRDPPSELLLQQFAKVLEVSPDYLFTVAGELPADVRDQLRRLDESGVSRALSLFRKSMKKGS